MVAAQKSGPLRRGVQQVCTGWHGRIIWPAFVTLAGVNAIGETILVDLRNVAARRSDHAANPSLAAAVTQVKQYQHARLYKSYADLLIHPRFAGPARFFLDDLYGPGDFSDRDAQFVRVVPALVRLFPSAIVATVADLAALHALSEALDDQMASAFLSLRPAGSRLDAAGYLLAWQRTGEPDGRRKQIALMRRVGDALDKHTRKPLLRRSLALMRGPAKAAGLAALQAFLERGFDTFAAMSGADDFLNTIVTRETALARELFAADTACAKACSITTTRP